MSWSYRASGADDPVTPLNHLLAPHCSLCLCIPLLLFAHSLAPKLVREWIIDVSKSGCSEPYWVREPVDSFRILPSNQHSCTFSGAIMVLSYDVEILNVFWSHFISGGLHFTSEHWMKQLRGDTLSILLSICAMALFSFDWVSMK